MTKIQFARFSFNGVDTTLLDRQTKKVNNGSVEGSEGAQVLEGTDLQSLIDKGLFKEAGGAEDAASGTSFAGTASALSVRLMCARARVRVRADAHVFPGVHPPRAPWRAVQPLTVGGCVCGQRLGTKKTKSEPALAAQGSGAGRAKH